MPPPDTLRSSPRPARLARRVAGTGDPIVLGPEFDSPRRLHQVRRSLVPAARQQVRGAAQRCAASREVVPTSHGEAVPRTGCAEVGSHALATGCPPVAHRPGGPSPGGSRHATGVRLVGSSTSGSEAVRTHPSTGVLARVAAAAGGLALLGTALAVPAVRPRPWATSVSSTGCRASSSGRPSTRPARWRWSGNRAPASSRRSTSRTWARPATCWAASTPPGTT